METAGNPTRSCTTLDCYARAGCFVCISRLHTKGVRGIDWCVVSLLYKAGLFCQMRGPNDSSFSVMKRLYFYDQMRGCVSHSCCIHNSS